MEELHGQKMSIAQWKDRVIVLVVGLFGLSTFYEFIQNTVYDLQAAATSLDIITVLAGKLLVATIVGGGGAMIVGFVWGSATAYLRLENGWLEYRWRWWKWDQIQKVDLRWVTAARMSENVTYYRGRKTSTPTILFTPKPGAPVDPKIKEDDREDPFVPLPKGVTPEEAELFVQKVNQEIKRVGGGW